MLAMNSVLGEFIRHIAGKSKRINGEKQQRDSKHYQIMGSQCQAETAGVAQLRANKREAPPTYPPTQSVHPSSWGS